MGKWVDEIVWLVVTYISNELLKSWALIDTLD